MIGLYLQLTLTGNLRQTHFYVLFFIIYANNLVINIILLILYKIILSLNNKYIPYICVFLGASLRVCGLYFFHDFIFNMHRTLSKYEYLYGIGLVTISNHVSSYRCIKPTFNLIHRKI